MINNKDFILLSDDILSHSFTILYGIEWKKSWPIRDKAREMRSVFTGNTQPCVPFENWVRCIEFLSYYELNNKTMGVTSPKQKAPDLSELDKAVEEFEKQLKEEPNGEPYYHLIVVGEYNRCVCDEIVRLYLAAGWYMVKCSTSSEKGEQSGLTGLQLWR